MLSLPASVFSLHWDEVGVECSLYLEVSVPYT